MQFLNRERSNFYCMNLLFCLGLSRNDAYIVFMRYVEFDWDPEKERANINKHGVSFEEARTVFYDENAIQFFDPDHSQDEERFILLGMSFKLRVPVVCHCYRKSETLIRIISARKATKNEAKDYWRRRP